ncbi:hypothetical protein STEG23_011804, partial [Scotinomys teguina]
SQTLQIETHPSRFHSYDYPLGYILLVAASGCKRNKFGLRYLHIQSKKTVSYIINIMECNEVVVCLLGISSSVALTFCRLAFISKLGSCFFLSLSIPILNCHHTWCCCGTPSDFYCATQT